MLLTPRYDGPPVIRIEGPVGDPSVALLRQRRRLAEALATLDDEQWAAPSRCEGWTVRDVIAHLVGANQYWAVSMAAGLAGEPTRYLTAFDPVATPAAMVDGMQALTPAEVLGQFVESTDSMASAIDGIDEEAWETTAESPPGHVALHVVARHALWDSWTHERDVLLPLGMAPDEEPDEVVPCLEYAAAIGPALLATQGSTRTGALVLDASDPDVRVVVEAGETVTVRRGDPPRGAVALQGPAVELIEALTFRIPLDQDVPAHDQWLLGGLAEVFDRTA